MAALINIRYADKVFFAFRKLLIVLNSALAFMDFVGTSIEAIRILLL